MIYQLNYEFYYISPKAPTTVIVIRRYSTNTAWWLAWHQEGFHVSHTDYKTLNSQHTPSDTHTPLKATKQFPTSHAAFLQLHCCKGMTSTKPPHCSQPKGLGRQVGFPVSTLVAYSNSACPVIHTPEFREQRETGSNRKKDSQALNGGTM